MKKKWYLNSLLFLLGAVFFGLTLHIHLKNNLARDLLMFKFEFTKAFKMHQVVLQHSRSVAQQYGFFLINKSVNTSNHDLLKNRLILLNYGFDFKYFILRSVGGDTRFELTKGEISTTTSEVDLFNKNILKKIPQGFFILACKINKLDHICLLDIPKKRIHINNNQRNFALIAVDLENIISILKFISHKLKKRLIHPRYDFITKMGIKSKVIGHNEKRTILSKKEKIGEGIFIQGSYSARRYLLYQILLSSLFGLSFIITVGLFRRFYFYSLKKRLKLVLNAEIALVAYQVAHDMKVPFNSLKGLIKLFSKEENPQKILFLSKEHLPRIESSLDKIERMMNDILNVGTDITLHKSSISPDDIILMSLKNVFRSLKHRHIEFKYHFVNSSKLMCDILKIERVIINIITNALEAMDDQGFFKFTCTTYLQKNRLFLKLSIFNSGSFIPLEDRNLMFKAFFTKGKKNGTGLGLTICKKIMDAHDGNISCTSTKGVGTEFHLTFPLEGLEIYKNNDHLPQNSNDLLAIEKKRPTDDKSLKEKPTSSLSDKIIIIDDDPLVHCYWKKLCDDKIQTFFSPQEFKKNLKKENIILEDIPCIVIDLHFGHESKMNGIDFSKYLRSSGFKNLIFLSSNQSTFKENNIKEIINDYIPKFSDSALVTIKKHFTLRNLNSS